MLGVELPEMPGEKDYEIIPDAWPAFEIFLFVQTQWRADSGVVIGLDYLAVKWAFELFEVERPRELLLDLQVIEAKVVEILSEKAK